MAATAAQLLIWNAFWLASRADHDAASGSQCGLGRTVVCVDGCCPHRNRKAAPWSGREVATHTSVRSGADAAHRDNGPAEDIADGNAA